MKKQRKIEKLVNKLYEEDGFNGCILVAEGGETIFSGAYGYAELDSEQLLTEQTMFDVASLSKTFTAMAVMILQERRDLNIDDTVDTYLTGFPYAEVTIRHLLHHTSGLPDYMDLFAEYWDESEIATNADVLELLIEHEPDVEFEPNEQHEYSNTGYVLLACLVEEVSQMKFAEFMKRHIFAPLGMTRTRICNRRLTDPRIKDYAYGYVYDEDGEGYVLPDDHDDYDYVVYLDGIQGDGAVNSTIEDLLKWDRALYTNELVSEETTASLFTGTWTNDEEYVDYGLGWRLDWQEIEDPEEPAEVVYHDGDWAGYTSIMVRNLTYELTIIILSNFDDDLEPLYVKIEEILLED
jgi:CubicO group peptidase (beta-lactamase class C family)